MAETLRPLCAIWPNDGGDEEIWSTRFISVPHVGDILAFKDGRRYRVECVEHEADLDENTYAQHIDIYVSPQ